MKIQISNGRELSFKRDAKGEWRGSGHGLRIRCVQTHDWNRQRRVEVALLDRRKWRCRIWSTNPPTKNKLLASVLGRTLKGTLQDAADLAAVGHEEFIIAEALDRIVREHVAVADGLGFKRALVTRLHMMKLTPTALSTPEGMDAVIVIATALDDWRGLAHSRPQQLPMSWLRVLIASGSADAADKACLRSYYQRAEVQRRRQQLLDEIHRAGAAGYTIAEKEWPLLQHLTKHAAQYRIDGPYKRTDQRWKFTCIEKRETAASLPEHGS